MSRYTDSVFSSNSKRSNAAMGHPNHQDSLPLQLAYDGQASQSISRTQTNPPSQAGSLMSPSLAPGDVRLTKNIYEDRRTIIHVHPPPAQPQPTYVYYPVPVPLVYSPSVTINVTIPGCTHGQASSPPHVASYSYPGYYH
ncbi:hypothetical protein VKT23_011578 [Stygiomarasmius scandens]|uniref:Uncharacterized protein n=1 Tax=Marasmiellus scandens TaxID=2682957 RepID=A0ABR1JB76_9AGAR